LVVAEGKLTQFHLSASSQEHCSEKVAYLQTLALDLTQLMALEKRISQNVPKGA